MIASVEAIFLSTFILITQNRMAAQADRRAKLDLQVSLLPEAEITKLVALVSGIAARMEVHDAREQDIEEMKRLVQPEAVLDAIEERKRKLRRARSLRCAAAVRLVESAVQYGGAADRCCAGTRPFGEILRQLGMPRACIFRHRALRCHPLFDRAPAIITLVRLHLSLRSETERPSPASR